MKKKYPQINSKTSVAEALHIIDLAEKKAKAAANTSTTTV